MVVVDSGGGGGGGGGGRGVGRGGRGWSWWWWWWLWWWCIQTSSIIARIKYGGTIDNPVPTIMVTNNKKILTLYGSAMAYTLRIKLTFTALTSWEEKEEGKKEKKMERGGERKKGE